MRRAVQARWRAAWRTPRADDELVDAVRGTILKMILHGDDDHQAWLYAKSDEIARAIIPLVQQAERADKWQDISTAPRDGTWIITAKVGWHHSADRIKIDMWDQPKNRYDVWHCSRAQFNGRYWTDGVERLVEPTHWMPLETPEPSKGPQGCAVPPIGWYCTREAGHKGPCAAIQTANALPGEHTQESQP